MAGRQSLGGPVKSPGQKMGLSETPLALNMETPCPNSSAGGLCGSCDAVYIMKQVFYRIIPTH